MTELEQQKEIARNAAVMANEPRAIYQSPFGGYAISTLNQHTNCKRVWTTEDIEPKHAVIEPELSPAHAEFCERIVKIENELSLFKEENK